MNTVDIKTDCIALAEILQRKYEAQEQITIEGLSFHFRDQMTIQTNLNPRMMTCETVLGLTVEQPTSKGGQK